MADFQSQAMGLTGLTIDGSSTTPSRAEFSTFLNDGVADVTSRWLAIRPQDVDDFLRESSEQTSNGFNPGTNKIISVIRESGTNNEWYPCTKESISLQYRVTDSTSLHYASKFNPVYMISQNRNIHVFPAPSSAGNDTFKVLYVNSSPEETDGSALDHASTGIKWFPEDKVYLVVLYASIRSIQAKMADTTISNLSISAVPPDVPSLTTVTFNSIDADLDSAIGSFFTAATFSAASVYTGSAPNYTKVGASTTALAGTTAFNSYWTLGDFGDSDPGALSVNAVAPDVPSLETITFASTDADLDATLPTYTFTAAVAGGIFGSNSSPDYTVKTITGQTSFNSFFESDSLNPFDDSDPGEFSLNAVAPDTPGLPTISYSPASVGDAIAAAQDAIASAQDAITVGPTDASGTTDTDAPSDAAGIDISAAPSDATGITDSDAPSDASGVTDTEAPQDASGSTGSYTKPTVGGDGNEITDVSILDTDNTIDVHADQLEVDQWWSTLGHLIEDEEDSELANSQIQKIQAYINAFQAEVQSASAAMQLTISNAQLATQASISNAQNDVNTNNASISSLTQASIANAANDVSTNNASIASLTQASIANASNDVAIKNASIASQTQASIANAANDVSTNNASMATLVQASIANAGNDVNASISKMQNSTSAATQKMVQSTGAAIQKMQLSTNVNVQNAAKTLEALIQDYNLELQKYQADLTSYGSEITAEVQEYQQKFQRYVAEMNTVYQSWAKTESDNIQKFGLDTQNELNDFNAKNVLFQANIQESMQELQIQNQINIAKAQGELQKNIDNENRSQARQLQNGINDMKAIFDNNTQLIAKYQAELSSYGAEVNTEIQEYGQKLARYQAELSTVYQAWAKTESDRIAAFQADIQDELNEFNKENVAYQAGIQEVMQEAQMANQVNIAKAQADIQLRIRNEDRSQERQFQNGLNDMKAIFDNNAELIQKYQAEVVTYQAEVAAEIQEYTQNLQGDGMGYQWLQDQYTRLKAEYDQAFMIAAPKQQEGAEA